MKNNSKFFEKIPGMHFIIMWLLWIFFFFDTATDTGVFLKKKKKKGVLYWLTLPLNSLNLLMRSMLSFFMDAITPGDES